MASLEDSRPSKRQCAASICPIAMDQRLPVELLTRLLYALPPHSAVALGRANKLLHRIVSQEALYWRECYRQRYGGEVCRQGFTWCDNEEIAESMDSEATLRAFLLNRDSNSKQGECNLQTDWHAAYRARANLELRWQRSLSSANAGATVIPCVRLLDTLTPTDTSNNSINESTIGIDNPWRRSIINVHAAYTVVANENGVWITPHPRQEGYAPKAKMLCYPKSATASTNLSAIVSPPVTPTTSQHMQLFDNQQPNTAPIPICGYDPRQCWSNGRWVVVAEQHITMDAIIYHVWEGMTGQLISCGSSNGLNNGHSNSLNFNGPFDLVASSANTVASTLPASSVPSSTSNRTTHQHACHLLAGSQLLTCTTTKNKSQLETALATQRWRLTRSTQANNTASSESYGFSIKHDFWSSKSANEPSPIVKLLVSKLRPNLLAGLQIIKPADRPGNNDEGNASVKQLRLLLWDMRGTSRTDQLPNGRQLNDDLDTSPTCAYIQLENIQPHDTPTICQDFTNDSVILHGNATTQGQPTGIYHWIACCTFNGRQHGSSSISGVTNGAFAASHSSIGSYGQERWRRTFPAWQVIWSAQPLHAVGHLAITFGEGDGSWQDTWLATADSEAANHDYKTRVQPTTDGFYILSLADGSLLRTFPMLPTRLIDAVGPMLIIAWDNVRHGVAAIDTVAGKLRWRQRFPEDEPNLSDTDQIAEIVNKENENSTAVRGWLDVRVSSTRLLMMERCRQRRTLLNGRSNSIELNRRERLLIVDFA